MWKETSYAVNHLGATDVNCVWGSFARLWLAGGRAYLPSAQSGWAERCSSWLDPQPERDIPTWCADLDISAYLSDIARFWARGEELPHVAEQPDDQLVTC